MSPPDGAGVIRRIIDTAEDMPPEPSACEPWPTMDPAAYYGLAGDVVRTIAPHSEADPVAILVQFLTAVGNAIGRGPYYQVEGDRHGTNLFGVLGNRGRRQRRPAAFER